MSRNPQLPKDISDKMDQMLREAGEKFRNGMPNECIELQLKAWALIPEPKTEWDFYPQVMYKDIVNDYTSIKNVGEAKKWIAIAYKMFNDPDRTSHYVLSLEATSLYKLDLLDESYEVFDRIFELFGREGFQGEDIDHSEFYFKERAKRQD